MDKVSVGPVCWCFFGMADADAEPELAAGEAEAAAESVAVIHQEAKDEDDSEEPLSSDEEADRLVASACGRGRG